MKIGSIPDAVLHALAAFSHCTRDDARSLPPEVSSTTQPKRLLLLSVHYQTSEIWLWFVFWNYHCSNGKWKKKKKKGEAIRKSIQIFFFNIFRSIQKVIGTSIFHQLVSFKRISWIQVISALFIFHSNMYREKKTTATTFSFAYASHSTKKNKSWCENMIPSNNIKYLQWNFRLLHTIKFLFLDRTH